MNARIEVNEYMGRHMNRVNNGQGNGYTDMQQARTAATNATTGSLKASGRAGRNLSKRSISLAWFVAGLLGLSLLPGLANDAQAAGQAPAKTGPGAPTFTAGDPA